MGFSSVTSEALQAKLRQLLPSQQGFGTDISASDTIIPIIDLTEAAEGSQVPEYLQRALAHGSQTALSLTSGSGSTSIATTSGFYQLTGVCSFKSDSGGARELSVDLSDGATTKKVTGVKLPATNDINSTAAIDVLFFVESGGSASITCGTGFNFIGSVRQVADSNGNLTNPSGFTPQ
jgi:hypothetical protein